MAQIEKTTRRLAEQILKILRTRPTLRNTTITRNQRRSQNQRKQKILASVHRRSMCPLEPPRNSSSRQTLFPSPRERWNRSKRRWRPSRWPPTSPRRMSMRCGARRRSQSQRRRSQSQRRSSQSQRKRSLKSSRRSRWKKLLRQRWTSPKVRRGPKRPHQNRWHLRSWTKKSKSQRQPKSTTMQTM